MKDIAFIMGQIPKKSLIELLVVYVLEAILIIAFLLLDLVKYNLYTIGLMGMFVLVFVVQFRRLKGMLEDGALHRILLLPIKRYAFMWSELFFMTASFFLCIIVYYVVWFTGQHLLHPEASFSTLLMMNVSATNLQFLVPDGTLHLCIYLLFIFLMGTLCLALSLITILKVKQGWASSLVYMTWYISLQTFFMNPWLEWFIVGIQLFCLFVSLYQINLLIGFRRKKVKA